MGYSEKEAVESLRKIVGSEHVITNEEDLKKYGSDQSFVKPLTPHCAVRPSSTEEVREIVLMANRLGVPIIPYSSGTNLHGAHIPTTRGVTVDLSRMDRIHIIDSVSRNVILEPGVTFSSLQDQLQSHGLRALTPVGVPSTGSVIGTYLELTPLFSWPKYSHWETLTLELVLPTGDIMGTGQMAIKASRLPYTWTTPYALVSRMFFGAQGTLGVITKAAITVKTLYEAARVFFVEVDDLAKMGDLIRKFLYIEATEEVFVASSHYLSLLLAKSWPDEFEPLRKSLAPWTLVMVVRGFEEEVEIKTLDLEDVASSLGVKLKTELSELTDAGERILDEIARPHGALNQNRYKGAWNPISCYATKDKLDPLYSLVANVTREHRYPLEDLGLFILPLNHGATFYFEPSFYRDPEDEKENRAAESLFLEASSRLMGDGAYFDRPYPLWAEAVYSGAPAYHKKVQEIKEAIDPKNIMNPGKLAL